jgi:hypothetical protein
MGSERTSQFLDMIRRGLGRDAAYVQLKIIFNTFLCEFRRSKQLSAELESAERSSGRNIFAAAYGEAIGGNLDAAQFLMNREQRKAEFAANMKQRRREFDARMRVAEAIGPEVFAFVDQCGVAMAEALRDDFKPEGPPHIPAKVKAVARRAEEGAERMNQRKGGAAKGRRGRRLDGPAAR